MGFFRSAVGGTVKSMVNIPGWVGVKQIKENTRDLFHWLKPVFMPRRAARQETFEMAMERMNLTEEDLKKRSKNLLFHAVIYLVVALIAFIYMFYLLFNGHFFVALLALLAGALFVTKTIASHFWYYQIKHRKLGCTLKEWWSGTLKEIKR